jgi:serine/threonine-protein kinase
VLNVGEFSSGRGLLNTEVKKPNLGQFLNGRYKLIRELSTKDFGQTFIAKDTWTSGYPQCVVKCFVPQGYHAKRSHIAKHRFTDETEILKKLSSHDQIPQLLDSFEDGQGFYLVREFIVGEPLSAELPTGQHSNTPLSESQCVAFLDEVLGILTFIHQQGVIYGDLKPSNLIRRASDGKLVLVNFGIAHQISQTITKPRVVPIQPAIARKGAPSAIAPVAIPPLGYIPAEQFSSQLCPSSDLYSLGIIAIQALTGLEPLQLQVDPTTGEISWQQHVTVSSSLACILNNLVRYDFRCRYQSAADVHTDVQTVRKRLMIQCEERGMTTEKSPHELGLDLSETLSNQLDNELDGGASTDLMPVEDNLADTDTEDLASCLHPVFPFPISCSFESSGVTGEIQETNSETQDSGAYEKWDYARELAIAFVPKLPPLVSGMSAGVATTNAIAISCGLYTLLYTAPANPELDRLERATEQYQQGKIDKAIALAQSIPANSSAYPQSVNVVQQWRQEWDEAEAQFQAVQQAFQEGRWRDVLDEAREAPNHQYWQHQIALLVEQAKPEVEVESQQLLKQAYQQAAKKDFTQALALLKQIPPETPTGAKIQPKLKEYSQKQHIKAEHLLQQAYQQASERNFQSALQYLSQIPEETPTYEMAQTKMAEYSRKQTFHEEVERQMQLAARMSQEAIKVTRLVQNSRLQKVSENLNPGNQLQEATP